MKDFQKRIGRELTNSCDLAVRLYAVAAQLEALYAEGDWMERQAFPQTAEGRQLDYHAEMRGLVRSPAVRAVGTLQFRVRSGGQEPVGVPAGTVCLNGAGVRYETTEDAVIPAGLLETVVPAAAVEAGSSGNTGSNTVLAMSLPPAGVVSCTNPAPFVGGTDEEGDESLRARILDSFKRLPNGANAAFYETEALRCPGVAAAKAVGRARGIGTVDVYIASTAGVPDEELLQTAAEALEHKREIAVDVQVKAPLLQQIPVQLRLKAANGDFETVKAAAEAALREYFSGERLGKPVLLSELHALLHSVEGLANYHILSPAEDTAVPVGTLPVLGTFTAEALTEAVV